MSEPWRQKVSRCPEKAAVLMGEEGFDQSYKQKLWHYRLTFVQKRTYRIAFPFTTLKEKERGAMSK